MKQSLMYLVCVGTPSSYEHVDQLNDMNNDDEDAYKRMMSM
jgi:hypothetical protein